MLNEIDSLRMSSYDIMKFLKEEEKNLRKASFTDYDEILINQ